jgi:membrane fusion protein (multidrug efflux system)
MADVQEQEQKQDQTPSNRGEKGEGGNREQDARVHKASDPRRKRTLRFVLLAVLVVAAIAAIPIYAYYSVRESTDDAQVDGHVVPISPRVSGNVLAVLVNDNQAVKAGDPLVRLDPADFQVAASQAEAQLASATANTAESSINVPLTGINTRSQVSTSISQTAESRAALASAQQAVNTARSKVVSANANLAGRQADLVKAQKDLVRFKELVDKDEISHQDYDAALAAEQASEASVNSAKADAVGAQHALEQAMAQVNQANAALATALVQQRQSAEVRPKQEQVSAARYKQAQALVKQSEANLNQARLNLSYTVIKAPVDGVVSRKSAEPGMQVSAGQQIMALIPLDDVWVTANFKETQLRKMRVGQDVQIEVDTYGSSRKYMGHIDSLAAASGARFSLLPPENATGNYVKVVQRVPVKILINAGENRDHRLLPGMSVTPTVLLNSNPNNPH